MTYLRPEPKDRSFLADKPIRIMRYEGRKGLALTVRLTSYRALPLSCIEGIELKIGGQPVDPATVTLILNGESYPISVLGQKSRVWWWILDYGQLFIEQEADLAPGEHEVEGTVITVEPYITAGRFSFVNTSRKYLAVVAEEEVAP